mmetsp:Transcript_16911/g.28174  ORF Transcript_16911/g.28174 Transcript_16911/m.28174 type:complete len:127 (+) Transcript_16911:126-506(+)
MCSSMPVHRRKKPTASSLAKERQTVWLRFYMHFLLATLCLTITMGGANGESSSETTTTVESLVPTPAPTPFAEDITDPPNTDGSGGNYWAILGPVLGGIGIAALCAMGCYMQHREYLFELQTRRRP